MLRELPSLVLQPGEAVRQHVAGCAASPLCVYLGTKNGFPALIWPLEGACRHGQYISGQYQPMAAWSCGWLAGTMVRAEILGPWLPMRFYMLGGSPRSLRRGTSAGTRA